VSTPRSLDLPETVRPVTVLTKRGPFATLQAGPARGITERRPALLVPGYTGSKEDFISVLEPLASAGRMVTAIDMRGQYQTPGSRTADGYSPGELAADVAALAAALAPDAGGLHLLGHSYGGLIARHAVLAGPAQAGASSAVGPPGVLSLTLLSSGPGRITGPRAAELRELVADLGRTPAGRRRTRIAELWRDRLGPQAEADGVPETIRAFLRERLLQSCPLGLLQMGRDLLSAPDRTPELARRNGLPVLVIYGENDDAWPPAVQDRMAAQLGARRVCIPEAAHSPAVEAPETTAGALTMFWNSVECGRSSRGLPASRDLLRLRQPVPRAIGLARGGALRAMRPVVAPATARPWPGREHLVQPAVGLPGPVLQVRSGAFSSDVLGPAKLPVQRGGRVLPGEDPPGRQVMQLDPAAGPPQHPLGGKRIERERQRASRVVNRKQVLAGLVVDDHELSGAVRPAPVIEPVDPAGHGDLAGLHRDGPLYPGRLMGRIEPAHIAFDHLPGLVPVQRRVLGAGEALVDPASLQQLPRRRDRPLRPRQSPPVGQRVVHARAEAVVRPRRSLRRWRAVQIGHPVPARAVQPGGQPRRRAHIQRCRHGVKAQLLHASIVVASADKTANGVRLLRSH
jgi:pimeloyl-ACP methyl ester carboxylesterase